MSVFSEILRELATYSAGVDGCTVSHSDFIDFQRLGDRIERAYNNGYYKTAERDALRGIYRTIKAGFRSVLGLDR